MHIGFISLHAWPLLADEPDLPVGGAERQAVLLAAALAQLPDLKVSLIVADCGQPPLVEAGQLAVRSHPCYRISPRHRRWRQEVQQQFAPRFTLAQVSPGLCWKLPLIAYWGWQDRRWLRARHAPQQRQRIQAWYQELQADVLVALGPHHAAVDAVHYARQAQIPTVVMLASDADVPPASFVQDERDVYGESLSLWNETLKLATAIIAQTEQQQRALRERMQREATVIANPIGQLPPAVTRSAAARRTAVCSQNYVLWIGKSDEVKRPELAVRFARENPHVPVVMILNATDFRRFARVNADLPDNVELIPWVPPRAMDSIYAAATVLINTSTHEGFPNTLLEAGLNGVPMVALQVDPAGYFSAQRAGITAGGDWQLFTESVLRLHGQPQQREPWIDNLRTLVEARHDPQAIARQLLEVIVRCELRSGGST